MWFKEEKPVFTEYDAYNHRPEEKRYGKWIAYKSGSLFHEDNLYIPEDKVLNDDTWVIHMMSAVEWVDLNTFIPAYLQACKNAGKKRIQVRTYF